MRHKSITLLLVLVMMLAGFVSLIYIPKDEFPQVDLPVGLVVGVYPGASELEVEQQLTKPLEDFLWTFKEIDRGKTLTMSMNDGCAAIVWLNGTESSKTEFWNKLKERLTLFRMTLPAGVLGVVANDDFGDSSAMLLTIESDSKTFRELGDYANGLGDKLRTVKSLANVIRMGGQNEQLSIYLDRDRLSMYGINTAMLMSKVSGLTGTLYTGSLEDGKLSRKIHIKSSLNTEQDLAQTIVSNAPTGEVIRLSDIATIQREYPEPRQYIKNNGRQCLLMSLQMIRGKNIIDFGTEVKQVISDYQQTLPKDVHINVISDQSQVVDHSIQDFMLEMLIAIVSVIIVVCLMLPLRVAGVAVVTIPITIFASIAIFLVTGVEINSVTLAALLVSLGMIVDDSVVVVDCYLDKLDSGLNRWQAAVESSREFVKSIITATLVISITFFPFLFTTDKMIHDFIQWFPYAISIVLTVSLVVAIFVVPILQHQFIKNGIRTGSANRQEERKTMLERIQGHYDRLIEWCFRHRRATLAIGLASIVLGAVFILMLPIRLMPRAERNQFAVDIILPTGTDLNYTAQVADSLASIMRKDERVVNLTTFYGSGSPRFHATFLPNFGGTHFAQFIVNTHNDKETQEMLDDYAHRYSYYFPEAQILFRQIEYSDHQYPVEVVVKGDNLDSLHVAIDSIHHRFAEFRLALWWRHPCSHHLGGRPRTGHHSKGCRKGKARHRRIQEHSRDGLDTHHYGSTAVADSRRKARLGLGHHHSHQRRTDGLSLWHDGTSGREDRRTDGEHLSGPTDAATARRHHARRGRTGRDRTDIPSADVYGHADSHRTDILHHRVPPEEHTAHAAHHVVIGILDVRWCTGTPAVRSGVWRYGCTRLRLTHGHHHPLRHHHD